MKNLIYYATISVLHIKDIVAVDCNRFITPIVDTVMEYLNSCYEVGVVHTVLYFAVELQL